MTAAEKLLGNPVLVLNRNWQAIQTAPVREAISLIAKGSALIIDPVDYATHDLETWDDVSRARDRFGDRLIRSSRLAIAPPEVIRLTGYDGMAAQLVSFSRRNIFKRDRYTCQFCGAQPGSHELTIDHLLPKSRGGRSTWTNCVLACVDCNGKKADRTPAEAGMRLRTTPKRPTWLSPGRIPPADRRESWEKFLSRAYWNVELEP